MIDTCSNKISTSILDDCVIEIFYNNILSKNPYLIRCTTFENQIDIRANAKDIKTLCDILNKLC